MAKWLAKEFDWDTGRYTGRYYDIAEPGIVAVFVDSFYGDDASADPEDPNLPLKTLGAAITYLNTNGADGSRIFMNGIFSETLPAQTYWYQFIGCGGGRNGRTMWNRNISVYPVFRGGSIYENIYTLNYHNGELCNRINAYILNCLIVGALIAGGDAAKLTVINSILYNCVNSNVDDRKYRRMYVYNSILYNYINNVTTYGDMTILTGSNVYLLDGGSTGLTSTTGLTLSKVETSDTAQFIDPVNLNFNVRLTSPLIGEGPVDEVTGNRKNIGDVTFGLNYNGLVTEFSTVGGATITDLTVDSNGKFTITAPATSGTLETALMDLGNIYPLENIDLFNVFDFLSGEITQGVFETFSSPRMALTIKLKYGLTSAEVDDCPWLLIEYGKQPTFSGTGASRVGNAADTFDPDTFQTITCRYMKLFVTLQNNS